MPLVFEYNGYWSENTTWHMVGLGLLYLNMHVAINCSFFRTQPTS